MDEQNQTQNPNTFSPSAGQPVIHKDHHWMLVGSVIFLLALFFVAWGYAIQMVVEPGPQPGPANTKVREDAMLSKEIQETDLGDVDNEFQAVDADINSL